jgi:GNAT superfamily N-acetyltransferase
MQTFPEVEVHCLKRLIHCLKIEYRLATCPELCMGVFSADKTLLAHIISTRTTNDTVGDNDMKYPEDWKTVTSSAETVGHKQAGRTVGLHSLAVYPDYQKRGIGSLLMKSYIQHLKEIGNVDNLALICQDVGPIAVCSPHDSNRSDAACLQYLVSYYEHLGFKSLGPSKATFGGGGWYDMVSRFCQQ